MIIKLTKEQKDFLDNRVLIAHKDVLRKIEKNSSVHFNKFKLIIDIDLANKLSELCEELLIKNGFDENFEPNETGKMAESIIDIISQSFF